MTVIAAPVTAHIALHTASAASGATVGGSGSGFSATGSAVQLHLDHPNGSALWSGAPDRGGAVVFSFTVPAVAPGAHTVVATQTSRDGDPVAGTPATAPLQITAASAPSPTSSQAGLSQGQSTQQKQPASQPHGQEVPGVPSVTAAPPLAGTPATVVPPPTAPPLVFSLPTHAATRLSNPPPQVATMWRVDGAVPRAATAATVAAPVTAPVASAPAATTGSRQASVLTLVGLSALVASAIVLIATTLQLRSADAPAPSAAPDAAAEVAPASPRRQPAQRRSATMRSPDLWSGSPARLR